MVILKYLEKYLICVILVTVAGIQLYHSQFDRLTPWKGGGFGMFSTNKRANITAVGYTPEGDSVIVNVIGSKIDVPISRSYLRSTKNFPKEENLERLGYLIVNSYLKPRKLEVPNNIDSRSAKKIKSNQNFYGLSYIPKHYQSDEIAEEEEAIRVDKVKITLYETDFLEKGLIYKKERIDEIIINRADNRL